jgi:hypothetical protein
MQMRTWILSRFGNNAVDFFSTVANSNGTINAAYNVDGVHVNNAGHLLFYKRIIAAAILDTLSNRYNASCTPTLTSTTIVACQSYTWH